MGGHEDDPDYVRRVQARISSLGLEERVSLLGHVDDLDAFIEATDVVVVPSVGHEGQPTAILDALARDRPVIVREHIWSDDFEGLPVVPYRHAAELPGLLKAVPALPVNVSELPKRFGPDQVLDAFERAAREIRDRPRSRSS